MDNPYSRCVRVSRSGPGLTTLPTLPAVGGRSRFGAFHSATALRGFSINDFFWFGPWKCGQSFPALSVVPRSGLGLPTFPQPHPAAALGPAIRHPVCAAQGRRDLHKALAITTSLRATAAATTLCGFPSFRSRSANSFKSAVRIEATSAA